MARTKTRSRGVADSSRLLARAARIALGKRLRQDCPRQSNAGWKAAHDRPDAVKLVLEAEKGRLPELLPLRHGRMARSPFTFFRGAALNMASDLATTQVTGVRVQCCGDAHLCNFGGFATPERRVIFAINDLDETLPAPWEWDVKRLAASFVVASRANGLRDAAARDAAMTCARSYRASLAEFSQCESLELWCLSLDVDQLVAAIRDPAMRQKALKRLQKERSKSIAHDIFPKLVEQSGERPFIKDQFPTIFHKQGYSPGHVERVVKQTLSRYRGTLSHAVQSLYDRYDLVDAALKVVGIGSVGTSCWVLLLMTGEADPLFIQMKEARASVLEPYAGRSFFTNHGERVVNGYRLMQPASDMFLGWTQDPLMKRHFFLRQLRDIKISVRVEAFGALEMDLYATWCGRALALSHARSGSSALLSGYLGKSDTFDKAIASFAVAYVDQNEQDHAALQRAIQDGSVEAHFEEDR